jgi:hypothetical protein
MPESPRASTTTAIQSSAAAAEAARAKAAAVRVPPRESAAVVVRTAPTVFDLILSELFFFVTACVLTIAFVFPNTTYSDFVSLRSMFVAAYLPLRAALAFALIVIKGCVADCADGGALEDASVVSAVLFGYIGLYHALPSLDLTGAIKVGLGKKAAGIARSALRSIGDEGARIMYYASAILALYCAAKIAGGVARVLCAPRRR